GLRPAQPGRAGTPAHLRTLPDPAATDPAALLPALRRAGAADRPGAGAGVQRVRGLARLAPLGTLRLLAAPAGGPARPSAQVSRLARPDRAHGGSDGRGPPSGHP